MRPLFLALPLTLSLVLPAPVLAETFVLTSRISAVTVYPEGAKVTRVAPYRIPAGDHQLQLLDLPQSAQLHTVRARLEGAQLGAVTLREDFVPPAPLVEDAARRAAEQRVEEAQEALSRKQDEIKALHLAREAADSTIDFLRGLNSGEALEGSSAEELRDIARMMGEETRVARQAVLLAEAEVRRISRDLPDLQRDLQSAQQALAALVSGKAEVMMVGVAANAPRPAEGELSVTYFVPQANWRPVNDAHLDLDTETLVLQRGALVEQFSGENWDQVALTLSTSQPSGAVAPSEVFADLRRVIDPVRERAQSTADSAGFVTLRNELASPEEEQLSHFPTGKVLVAASEPLAGGLIVTYDYPQRLTLATGADAAKLALDPLEFPAEIAALAVPLHDSTAFLTATFTNESDENILPSQETQLFLAGELVGTIHQPMLSAGAEARLPFGPIEGLQLSRVVSRNDGDRGILSKSNERVEQIRIEVENVTERSWPVRLIDRVPYSEQEDLQINWTALPEPDERDVEKRRNVLAWTFDIAPGATRTIKIDQRLSWPEEMLLR